MSINGKRCVPLLDRLNRFDRGALLYPPITKKGGMAMITVSDFIQICILIVGLIDLVLKLIEHDRDHRQ